MCAGCRAGKLGASPAKSSILIKRSGPPLAIQYDGNVMSTVGQQTTPAEFIDFLDSIPDISAATFTLNDVTHSGLATVFNAGLFIQQFSGGTLSLYDESHVLLLSSALTTSGLSGTAGAPDGGLFTTTLGPVTGGTLAPSIDAHSAVLQMHLSNINGGAASRLVLSNQRPLRTSIHLPLLRMRISTVRWLRSRRRPCSSCWVRFSSSLPRRELAAQFAEIRDR